MTDRSPNVVWHDAGVSRGERWRAAGVHGVTVWLTGLSGSGKSTIAAAVSDRLAARGRAHVHARRRQPAPRAQRRPRLLGGRSRRERSARRRGGTPVRGRRRGRARAGHQPVSGRAGARPSAAHGRRPGVRRGVRGRAGGRLRGPRPEGPLREGSSRRDHRVHRCRRSVRAAVETRPRDRDGDDRRWAMPPPRSSRCWSPCSATASP